MFLFHGSPELVQAAQALDLAKMADLKKLRDWYFDCLLVCTGLVGIGLLMEAPEIWHDVREAIGRKSRELKYWLAPSIDRKEYPTPSARVKVLAAVGWVLIVLGVMGEGVSEGFVHKYDTALSTLNDTLIAETQREASANEKEAAQLRLKAEELEEQILEQGPRDLLLYGKREESFTNSIRQFKGQKVQVRICVFGNNEVRDTAERLTALFKKAEWDVSPHSPKWGESNCMLVGPNEPIPSGIWVGTPNPRPTPRVRERAKELVRCLSQIPLAATLHRVGIETARSSESRESINEQYGDPGSMRV